MPRTKGTGTTVVVTGAKLHAGRDVLLSADERSNLAADTVTATDIAYAIDNSDDGDTLVAASNNRAYAFTHTMAVTNVSGATIDAGRNAAITGHVENDQSLTGTTGGSFVESSTGAVVDGATTITAAGNIDVFAHADLFDTSWSICRDLTASRSNRAKTSSPARPRSASRRFDGHGRLRCSCAGN